MNTTKWTFTFIIIIGLSLSGLFFQNFTSVDFTSKDAKQNPAVDRTLRAAIQKSDRQHLAKQKDLGLDNRQIRKKYLHRRRAPASIGDIPLKKKIKKKKTAKTQKKVLSLESH